MDAKQISTMVGRLVEHQSNFFGLPTDDGQWVIQNPKDAIALFVEATKNRQKNVAPQKQSLAFLGTVEIPASAEPFIAKEKFVVDVSDKAKVKISYLGENFEKIFLNKTDPLCASSTLRYHRLLERLVDDDIIAGLGGKDTMETGIYGMFFLMEKQGHGQSGILLTNSYANIFYILDDNLVLWAVRCYWRGVGWSVDARPVDDTDRWHGGNQVFSCNSSESQH